MGHDLPTQPALTPVERLHRLVSRLRRRAALSWSATALIAALAADLGYDLANLLLVRLTGKSLYFPVLFPLAMALLAAVIVRRTRPQAFCRSLDDAFNLKDRLAAAERYRRTPGIPAAVVAAQAAETLARIDPRALASRFAFRPRLPGALLLLVAGAWVGVRLFLPEQFMPPRNLLLQQGQVLVARAFRHPRVAVGPGGAPGRRRGRIEVTSVPPEGVAEPSPAPTAPTGAPAAPVPPTGPPPPEPKKPEEAGRPEEKGPQPRTAPSEPQPAPPAAAARQPGADATDNRKDSRGGVAPPKAASVEVGKAVAPLGVRPDGTLAPPLADLKAGAGAYLPPVPLFRLLGRAAAGALLDPETLYVEPDTYQPRYRDHLVRYFERLQQLGENRHGS